MPNKGDDRSRGQIEIVDFSLVYRSSGGPMLAVDNASIHVAPGEFVTIIGPSGCGKSSLLNAVAGFIAATKGRVTVDGEIVDSPSADRGIVFQQYSLFPWMTVRQNVEFGLKMKGFDRLRREQAARTLLAMTGLAQFENHYPDALSGGMKQRVGIVRALAPGPKVLLLDEPFGALDAQTKLVMQQILMNIWQQLCISVLFVTHDIDEAIYLSDRIYCMTARPGAIKTEFLVPLPRPRQRTMLASKDFMSLRESLMEAIAEESMKSFGVSEKDIEFSGIKLDGHSLFDVV